MRRRLFLGVLAVLALAVPAFTSLTLAQETPLIPREILVGNPEKAALRLSPDGTRLSYLAPSEENVLHVWVRTIDKEDDVMVTNDTVRGIRRYFWAEDGNHILYLQDIGGDENWHVYSADLATKVVRDLTPFQGIRAENIMLDKKHPEEMLVGLNLRDRTVFDMYRVNLTTGALVPDTENPGDIIDWATDPSFKIRAAVAMNPQDGSQALRVRDSESKPWRELINWPHEEQGGPVEFTADGKSMYVETSLGSDTTRLVIVDLATGKEAKVLAQDPRVDVGHVMIHPDTYKVEAIGFDYLRREWKVLDPVVEKDFQALGKVQEGDFFVTSRDRADDTWIAVYLSDRGPVSYYVYDRKSKKATFLFDNRPELRKYQLAEMKPVVIKARDGLELVSYLTLPLNKEPKNLPLVLNVHGGPWARDSWGLDMEAQWMANRGYAVLQVNFRGSTGFGKKFLNAGDGEWGVGAMQHDLTDAVLWAIDQGIANPERVAIYGGSYGGYATLAGLTFTPELYRCGVDIVGPSNIKTLLEAIPPYWAPLKKMFTLRVGDVEQDEDLNKKISPLYHVDNIKAPLLIAQGANDPRVNIRESTQMVAAMRANELEVGYVVYTDEGHGFARPENRLDFYGRSEEFLAKHLDGRIEPLTEIEGTSADLR
jgi:dipeptidyl aminopeptidase/acylaminoacyl peptidase